MSSEKKTEMTTGTNTPITQTMAKMWTGPRSETSHDLLAWFVYAVVILHIAATFWHALVKRDGTLARMWPGAGHDRSV